MGVTGVGEVLLWESPWFLKAWGNEKFVSFH
jgi:hypothetical protein